MKTCTTGTTWKYLKNLSLSNEFAAPRVDSNNHHSAILSEVETNRFLNTTVHGLLKLYIV